MKNLTLPLLVLGIAGAMLVTSPAEANDKAVSKSKLSRPCRDVKVAVVSRTSENDKASNGATSEPYFNNDYTAQHPSGGG
jgi:hypothetical protein